MNKKYPRHRSNFPQKIIMPGGMFDVKRSVNPAKAFKMRDDLMLLLKRRK